MSEENQDKQSSLPPLLTPEEIRRKTLQPYWLDPTVEYPEPHFLFEYNGVGFSPLGGIQALSGQKKNGKTFVLAQLMAAALGTGTERVSKYLPGLHTSEETINWLGHEPGVLYCDTEMDQLNTAKVHRRVHWLCGWDMKERSDRFFVQWLREVEKTDIDSANHERWRLIKNAIEDVNPDIVFIDGVRDIVNDFNDNKESSSIVGEMMSVASKRNICIWNVLHMNPRPGNDDESKMRGHLGTELGNKVSDTFVSSKKKTSTGVQFTVKQMDARGKDVEDWSFEIVDDAGNLGIPRIISSVEPEKVVGDNVDDITNWINRATAVYEFPMSRADVKRKVFGEIGGVTNHGKQQQDLIIALNMKLLVESTMKSKGSYMLMPPEEMPF